MQIKVPGDGPIAFREVLDLGSEIYKSLSVILKKTGPPPEKKKNTKKKEKKKKRVWCIHLKRLLLRLLLAFGNDVCGGERPNNVAYVS